MRRVFHRTYCRLPVPVSVLAIDLSNPFVCCVLILPLRRPAVRVMGPSSQSFPAATFVVPSGVHFISWPRFVYGGIAVLNLTDPGTVFRINTEWTMQSPAVIEINGAGVVLELNGALMYGVIKINHHNTTVRTVGAVESTVFGSPTGLTIVGTDPTPHPDPDYTLGGFQGSGILDTRTIGLRLNSDASAYFGGDPAVYSPYPLIWLGGIFPLSSGCTSYFQHVLIMSPNVTSGPNINWGHTLQSGTLAMQLPQVLAGYGALNGNIVRSAYLRPAFVFGRGAGLPCV